MANLLPKGRSNTHIGIDNKEAIAAYLGKSYKKPKQRDGPGKGDNRRQETPETRQRFAEGFDNLDWNR